MLVNIEQPPISEKKRQTMLKRIKPLVRKEGKLYFINPVDPVTVAFTWDPECSWEVPEGKYLKIGVIPTFHKWGYYGFFKPSIEEVLKSIPAYLVNTVAAFEVEGPDDAHDLNLQKGVLDAGYHMAMTTLYREA